ncbi:hypothetical protein [Methanolobus sp. WCC4]|uniref:hypothetical protein n=1 Tax=Methanolobus sp. WCC4 TaxID=3125784 RepID=UPI0030FB23FC
MNDTGKYFTKNGRTFILAILFLVMMLLITSIGSAASIQKFSIDSKVYASGEAITVSGEILNGNSSGEVEITIWPEGDELTDISNQSANKTIYASDGTFSTTINAPVDAEEYTIVAEDVESGVYSPYLYLTVVGQNDPQTIKILFTEGEVLSVSLSDAHGIAGSLNNSKTGGNLVLGNTTYYFLVSDEDVAYVDDDPTMELGSDSNGISVIGNLVQGSKVKLNGNAYRIIHINNDTDVTLARTVTPSFTGGESVNVTVLALNSSSSPVGAAIELEYFKDDGTEISTTNITTDSTGVNTSSISIASSAGTYHLVADDIGHISFVVNTMDLFGDILSTEYTPKHTFAHGEVMVPVVYAKNLSSGTPLADADITATITSKNNDSYSNTLTLEYDSNISAYITSYTIPMSAEIDTYYVEYEATLDNEVQKAYTSYNIKAYDLFLKVVSKERGEGDGFAPGEEGFLVIAGTNLSNGQPIDLNELTSFNISKYSMNITDSDGDDVTSSWSIMNASTFYTYASVPTDIQEEVKQMLGEDFAVINFTTPSSNGIYDVHAQVELESEWTSVWESIIVQDVFIHGEPVNKMGWFSPTVAPDAAARIMIMAFDPSTGSEITDINDAGLVEVWSESAQDVVTEYMEDPVVETIDVPFMGTQTVLKFNVTDNNLGFHYVRFWANVTVDGTPQIVMGDAWFDEKLYSIRAKPAFDDNSSMFKVFGSEDDIELSVHVEDLSGNDVSSASIKVESVRYGMTGETVPVEEQTSSVTTDSSGDATLTITPENSLKSGFYSVRVKMTTQDGTIDYGNGWFEVSNFIFYPYSTSWEVGLNQPVNFSLNAFDSSFGDKEVNVTLTKIISMGDWDMMSPPTIYSTTEVDIGSINGTGYYEYPGLADGGNYEFVFEATDGTSTEVGRAWVHATAFVAWVDSGWEYEFPTNGFINVTVKASDDGMWGSSAHNVSNVTVEKVMQEGMWMTSYKTKSEMASITTTEAGANPNEMDISINTSGWGQGGYMMTLKVTDDTGNEVYTDFWFKLELASVSVTNPMMLTVNAGEYYTAGTSINASSDINANQDNLASMGNISAGKISGPIIGEDWITPISESWDMGIDYHDHDQVPYFSLVAVDSVRNTVYIEFENRTDDFNIAANLSDSTSTQVFNASVGDNFTDYTGRTWNITDIATDGTIELEGVNTLKNGLILNDSIMAMSQSGKFLITSFRDEEWQNIDLDGDDNYFDDNYIVLMADSITTGRYDKVLVSNSSNFSAGYIDASAGEAIEFGGAPIYLLSNKYQSNAYNLEFSTYSEGWNGMHMGTFQNGSTVKIPFLVESPSGEALTGKLVTIDYLIDESKQRQTLSGINATTDDNGLAVVEINTSEAGIPTGSWMIHYNVTLGSEYAVANEEMFWELTRFELRNFVVSGALGTPGEIDLVKLYDDNPDDGLPGNDMLLAYGDEIEFQRGISAHYYGVDDTYALNWPFNNWYYNSSTQAFNYSDDWGNTMQPGSVGVGATINSSGSRMPIDYTVDSVNNIGDTIVLNLNEPNSFYGDMWNFTLSASDGTTATIDMSYVGWPWTVAGSDPWSSPMQENFNINQSFWIGGFDFEVTTINTDSVILTLRSPLITSSLGPVSALTDDDTSNGELASYSGAATEVTFGGQDYYLFGYNDQAGTMHELLDNSYLETKDRVLVVNASNTSQTNTYRIGETIDEFGGYYVASVANWGGRFILLNSSVTQVYPIPGWSSDEPVFYAGKFSDEDVGVDMATAGGGFDDAELPGLGEITSDDRYHILLFDGLMNGVSFPTQAKYDDDPDLTNLRDWENYMNTSSIYDMYDIESGSNDAFIWSEMGPVQSNMTEGEAYDIGTGNMDNWPMSFPSINIDDASDTATLKTFVSAMDVDVNETVTIYVTAKDFDGTPVNGTATLQSLKMSFGGTFTSGPAEDIPVTWDMSSAMINTTLVNGEGTLEIAPSDLSEIEYDFGEFTAFVDIEKDSGGVETLKMNFFRFNEDMMDMFEDEGPMGSEGDMGGDMEDGYI